MPLILTGPVPQRVIVETPFKAPNHWEAERNVAFVRAAIRDCILRGEAPFASHAIYTLPNILDDNVPEERELGIKAGFAWRPAADLTVVYTNLGISSGMQLGIDHSISIGCPVEYRILSSWTW